MVGIADLPVEIITGLKISVQKSNAERAEKAKAASIASSTDLTLSKQSTLESTVSNHSNVSSTSSESTLVTTTDVTDSEVPDVYGNKVQEEEIEMRFLTPDKRSHTISVDDVHRPKHSHTMEPGDSHSHKAAIAAEEGVSTRHATIVALICADFPLCRLLMLPSPSCGPLWTSPYLSLVGFTTLLNYMVMIQYGQPTK